MLQIEPMTIHDYDDVFALWQSEPGICIRDEDSREGTQRYLERNPGLSFIARLDNVVTGSLLCGHDGRRGFLHHLVVLPEHRGKRIGRELVEHSLNALKAAGIHKCYLFVMQENAFAQSYWETSGWERRQDVLFYSRALDKSACGS